MRRAIESLEQTDGVSLLEQQLLGALMLCPYLRLDCQALRPGDFSSPFRGAAFQAVMAEKRPELGSVVHRLETDREPFPPGRTGWADTLARIIEVAFVEDDAVLDAVKAIKEAARERKRAARLHAL